MSDYHSLEKKNDKMKAALERIRQERDSLKKQLEDMEMARAIEAAERDDLEKKLQDSVQNLNAAKVLHNEVVSQLEAKKKDQDKCATESTQLRGEVASLQLKVVDAYDAGFGLAAEHMKIIAPGLDTSRLSPQLEVRNGQSVPCEPFVNQGNALA
jgi:chromosome segregation ATPase